MPLTLPDNAPFTGAQRMWIKGFLDGINSTIVGASPSASAPAPPAAPPAAGIPLTIAWGSQTGNSEALGKKLARTLAAKGHAPVLKDLADLTPGDLTSLGHLLIITSTYGDGEPPDNAASFHTALHTEEPPLDSLNYSVFALGDSNYPSFCQCGRDFDTRLASLGAKRLTTIIECDVDYDAAFNDWLQRLEQVLAA